MDKVKLRKLRGFLLGLDEKIKEMKTYLALEMGDLLLSAIASFEEENAEFLQYYAAGQEELNKRKQIIQCLLFPIISDDKIREILEYHILEPLDAGLDLEELMKMRALTTPELLWPKITQGFLKSLTQNSQVVGSSPLISAMGDSMPPQIKNWIAVYNRRFGIEKHEGLEPHQFILEDPNTQKLPPKDKEKLLKILKFYEGLKVYSLSEIESELRKIQTDVSRQGSSAKLPALEPKRETSAPSAFPKTPSAQLTTSPNNTAKPSPNGAGKNAEKKIPISFSSPSQIIHDGSAEPLQDTGFFQDAAAEERIKITGQRYDKNMPASKTAAPPETGPAPLKMEIEGENIENLIVKHPALKEHKITKEGIRQAGVPLGLTPNIQNWIEFYQKECGKGNHSPQARSGFVARLKSSQSITADEAKKLEHIFRSLDDKTPLPYDKIGGKILFDRVGTGEKLKISGGPPARAKLAVAHRQSLRRRSADEEEEVEAVTPSKKEEKRQKDSPWNFKITPYSSDLDIQLVSAKEKN